MRPVSLYGAGLSLWQSAGQQMLQASASVASPELVLDGMVQLQAAEVSASLGMAVLETAMEMDAAVLDLLV